MNPVGINYEKTYKKWRKLLIKTNMIIILYVFLMEIIMFFVLKHYNFIYTSRKNYLVKYLLLPTLINVSCILVGSFVEKKTPKNSGRINYIPVIELVVVCFVLSTFHHTYSVTRMTFCVPLLTTIIFADRKMVRRIFYLCALGTILSTIFGKYIVMDYNKSWEIIETIIAVTILTGTYQISKVLIIFQQEKNNSIIQSYKQQLDMQIMLDKDQKTGLYNHTMFMNKLRECTEKCIMGEQPFALAIIDIDNFKEVNDCFGHAKGDNVITKLSEIILNKCSNRQFPARFGGEEFAIIFDERSANNAFEVVEEIREEFSEYVFDFSNSNVTVSCGIATWKNPWKVENIFDNADRAMYLSKSTGKNKTSIYK